MKIFMVLFLIFMFFCVGWLIYLEVGKDNFNARIQKVHQTAERSPIQDATEQTSSATRMPDENLKLERKMNGNEDVSTIGKTVSEENIDNQNIHVHDHDHWTDDIDHSDEVPQKRDPWQQTYPEKKSQVRGYESDLNVLIEKFGDIPQVHTAHKYLQKIIKGKERTVEDVIAGMEALKYLYPELHSPEEEAFLQLLKEGNVTFITAEEASKRQKQK